MSTFDADKKVYIIAEIGINHNGELENALKLIDAAAAAGCSAVKFQLFSAKNLYPRSAGDIEWKDNNGSYTYGIYEAVQSFELPEAWLPQIMEHAAAAGIEVLASVFDQNSLDLLISCGIKKIKLSSYTVTHLPLIEACAATGLPIIMSTGGATLGEVEEAVDAVYKHHEQLSLLHCSIKYPTEPIECNLGVIETLKIAFPRTAVGYSDHTLEALTAPSQAAILGAKIVEKHITLDKKMPGPDHYFALEPAELTEMVMAVRSIEHEAEKAAQTRKTEDRAATRTAKSAIDPILYGSTAKVVHQHERYLRDFAYPTIFANRKIETGEVIGPEDLIILRPGKKQRGLDPKYLTLFSEQSVTAKKSLKEEDPITWESILS